MAGQDGTPTVRTVKDEPVSNGDLLVEEIESGGVSTGDAGDEGDAGAVTEDGLEDVGFELPALPQTFGLESVEPSEAGATWVPGAVEVDEQLRDVAEASYGAPGPVAETVQGPDDRIEVAGTDRYPWRAHASLRVVAADGSLWIGTGWFVSPRVLITAGHVVHLKDSGVPGRDGWVRQIRVMPGRRGPNMPFGTATSVRFYTVRGWADEGDPEYDYGAIVLTEPLGDRTGWFEVGAYSDARLASFTANVSGYPGDKPAGTQWYHGRRIDSTANRKVFYDTDTAGGQSGSAVYRVNAGKRTAFAIHAYGGSRTNSGTRITRPVFDNITAWIAAHP